jgi:hypothetical protein
VLLDLAVVMLPKLAADRSNKLDHLVADFLYHFQRGRSPSAFNASDPGGVVCARGMGIVKPGSSGCLWIRGESFKLTGCV